MPVLDRGPTIPIRAKSHRNVELYPDRSMSSRTVATEPLNLYPRNLTVSVSVTPQALLDDTILEQRSSK